MIEEYWKLLEENRVKTSKRRIEALFEKDETRFNRFSLVTDDFILDYSKTNIDDYAMTNLLNLAEYGSVKEKTEDMFSGKKINITENRSVLHTLLRNFKSPLVVDGLDISLKVNQSLDKALRFSENIRSGKIVSATGERFQNIINIGIGGSELGPKMVARALSQYQDGPQLYFVSNLDSSDLIDTISGLDLNNTLIIISSKSFTTVETLTNANTIKNLILSKLGPAGMKNFVAVCSAKNKALEFGVHEEKIFEFDDWVGGRFSVWGSTGLPVMLAVGADVFRDFLDGASSMDSEFRNAKPIENLPIMLALVGIWHASICKYPSRVVLPYEQRLEYFSLYLQQLDMESNGKSIDREGRFISRPSTPISWGQTGTNGQHAFYQFLHQSNQVIPCEFILGANSFEENLKNEHHDQLIANCLAQSEALMTGIDSVKSLNFENESGIIPASKKMRTSNPHLFCVGNRPSTTLIYRKLTPRILGKLLALFEHRTFVEGFIWNLNSFDQWGVELGKKLAKSLTKSIKGQGSFESFSSSTIGLVKEINRFKK